MPGPSQGQQGQAAQKEYEQCRFQNIRCCKATVSLPLRCLNKPGQGAVYSRYQGAFLA